MFISSLIVGIVLLMCSLIPGFIGLRMKINGILKIILLALSIIFGLLFVYFIIQLSMASSQWGSTDGPQIDTTNSQSALVVIDLMNINTRPEVNRFVDGRQAKEVIVANNQAIDLLKQFDMETIFLTSTYDRKTLLRSIFNPNIPVFGTKEAGVNPDLHKANCRIFNKFKADGFTSSEFDSYLREKKIRSLFITGTATEACVNYTILGALNRGYNVFVVKDGVYSLFGDRSFEKFSSKWQTAGATIITIADLTNILNILKTKGSCSIIRE
jgi:nicotinamidase-related amidase